MSSDTPVAHEDCMDFLYATANATGSPLDDVPGLMLVSRSAPTVTAPEFPAQSCRCPHGTRYYTYPSVELIASLRALNGVN